MKKKDAAWLRLDNAAKIFPASLRAGWSNVFRLSVTFSFPVDREALESAVKTVSGRFPSVCVRLKRGLFWYYLEETAQPPKLVEEGCQPLLPMTRREIGKCAVRILYYENRIAAEFFHALTDGTGALVFMKTLAAVYLEKAKNICVPCEKGVLSVSQKASREELEDSFLKYAGTVAAKRDASSAYRLQGIREPDGYIHVTSAEIPLREILQVVKQKKVSLTTFLAAVLTVSAAQVQREQVAPKREKPVRIQIPVNLRRFFPSQTLRNFVSVYEVGLEKGECDADFEETLFRIHHQMALHLTKRDLRAVFTANVKSERGLAIRLVPLFLKNIVMRAVFDRVGENRASLCLSNLGMIEFPDEMSPFVKRFDFIIGPQANAPYNCAACSCGDTLRINLVRNTREPALERVFFKKLSSFGFSVTLESNER